jgi:nucleoside 2-deoxyribosyltransferase
VEGGGTGSVTGPGWSRVDQLNRSEVSSRFAFFARQFANVDLDRVYEQCLIPAVRHTGFELRPVTQRAGLVDAIIEDEIRRCAFVIADLSDDNAGAYWEAGFAEGLGKPVIYICKKMHNGQPMHTHFDADHRHTVRWDLGSLDQTARQLKAVIRNTLLGKAKQIDN